MLASFKIRGFIPTKNLSRAKKFYLDVLGLKFESEDQFALEVWAGQNRVRIVPAEKFEPFPFTVLGWEVPDIQQVVAGLSERGVAFERYPAFLKQDASGIWDAPGGGRVAWFKDPDGNHLALTQYPEK